MCSRGLLKAACGWQRMFVAIMDGDPILLPVDLACFQRIQVNHSDPNVERISSFSPGTRCIAQARSEVFPDDDDVDWLYDCSGGRGQLPTSWPPHPDDGRLVGFAGGIGPENVSDVLVQINSFGRYWIDMESRVRADDWLDLDKVEAVCQAVYGLAHEAAAANAQAKAVAQTRSYKRHLKLESD